MRRSLASAACLLSVASVLGCEPSGTEDDTSSTGSASTSSSMSGTGGATSSSGTGFQTGASSSSGAGVCVPPDLLIALDRTLTMHFQPNGTEPTDAPSYTQSKWSQAITAIETLVKPPVDTTIRFGLELWPKEEPGCITLAQRVENTQSATNPFCSPAEVLVPPALGAGASIQAALDPTTTKICISTPTGDGLLTAASALAAIKQPDREQFILLVTDGADWEQSCPTPDPVETAQALAAAGVKTFVLGFSATGDIMTGGIGAPFLNDMACAGMTAPDLATNCVMGANGMVAKDPTMGPMLYYQASDAAALGKALEDVAALVCCDCVK